MIFKLIKATSRNSAIAMARAMCRCNRMSFAGVRWREGAEVRQMSWAEIDRPTAGRLS